MNIKLQVYSSLKNFIPYTMTKLYSYILFILLLLPTIVKAQITTSPEFPNANSEITITFDSSKESGLGTFTGDLYAHTGVMIEGKSDWQHVIGDWGNNTTQPKLANNNDGTYSLIISPNITDYYSVPTGEVITQIALVFRSADGNNQTNDLFIDVYADGLNVSFNAPSDNQMIAKKEELHVAIKSNISESLSLYLDDVLVEETTIEQEINTTIQTDIAGNHELIAVATASGETIRDTIHFYVREDVIVEDMPAGIIEGINYIDDNTVTLAMYAPKKDFAYVIGDFTNWEINNAYQLKKDEDYYWITIENLTAGQEYVFQYVIGDQKENVKIADPYADKVLDPWNDKYITDETYLNLIDYPEGKTTEIASVFQTAQTAFNWTDNGFTMPKKEDLVVYELHVRDFTAAGNIKTITDTLNYLERLGVNAIELMPFNEFEGNDSWGYNPSFYFAPDKAYGTKDDYKTFINECHKRGIAVFMDMVLNHTFGQSPFLRMYFDSQLNQPTENNPWYNQEHNFENTDAHWGYDINHESEATQKLVDRINKYWMEEYHIDGFRFDFTKGFSNTPHPNSGSDDWGSDPDDDRIRLLKRMANEIWKVKSDAVVIFEHLSDNTEETELANHGIMLWGNANHDYNEATMGYDSDFRWTSWKQREWNAPNLVSYMESHDEERLMFKNLEYGNSGDYKVTELNTALARVEAAAAFFFTIPGPKMIWQFGELGYDFSINYNERVGKKPIRWEYYENGNRKRLYDVFAALIKIKKEEMAFESDQFRLFTDTDLKRIEIDHEDMDVRIVGNFDMTSGEIQPKFSKTGVWYDYFSGEEVTVNDINATIKLESGEYHIYTSKKLTTPEIPSAPVAHDLAVEGVFQKDEKLTINYNYSDIDGDLEGESLYQWYRADDEDGTNEKAISGATSSTYTLINADGGKFIRFAVTPVAQTGELLTGNTAYSMYTDEIIIPTGINDILEEELKMYPNPVKDILHLSNLKGVDQIKVYSLNGRIVRTIGTPNTSEELNLSNLASGMYLFVFEMEDGSKLTKKVMKQ